jgi:hypothetical protein
VPNVGPQTEALFLASPTRRSTAARPAAERPIWRSGLALTEHRRSLILRRINKDAVKLVERAEEIVGHRNGYNGQLQRWKLGGLIG